MQVEIKIANIINSLIVYIYIYSGALYIKFFFLSPLINAVGGSSRFDTEMYQKVIDTLMCHMWLWCHTFRPDATP